MIPDSAVKAIQESVQPIEIEIDGQRYASRQVYLPPDDPMPTALKIHTLSGLIDYVNKVADKPLIQAIQVVSHNVVDVIGPIVGRHSERATFARAVVSGASKFSFGQYMTAEDFVIGLQIAFVASEERALLLSIAGNLKDESVKSANDDGVTQTVATRKGISLATQTVVPNPVSLAPFRTFAEISQPKSFYVLRLKRKENELPQAALFETGDMTWELEAIRSIKQFLTDAIQDIPVIA